MYEYIFHNNGNKVNIKTPGINNLSQIKNETLEQTPEFIHQRSTYPNGFTVEYFIYPEKTVVRTNRELINNGDGSYTAPVE